jgi:hypothetical protein
VTPLAVSFGTSKGESSVDKMKMKSFGSIGVVMLMVALLFSPLFAQQQEQAKSTGVLANLKVDQAINVKELGSRYLLTVIESKSDLPMPHTILELGPDYIVIRDFTGLNETRIPIYSIQAVVNFKGFLRR